MGFFDSDWNVFDIAILVAGLSLVPLVPDLVTNVLVAMLPENKTTQRVKNAADYTRHAANTFAAVILVICCFSMTPLAWWFHTYVCAFAEYSRNELLFHRIVAAVLGVLVTVNFTLALWTHPNPKGATARKVSTKSSKRVPEPRRRSTRKRSPSRKAKLGDTETTTMAATQTETKPGPMPEQKFCKYCGVLKVPGSHHCRHCDICVHNLDHHCPFINGCVGRNNQRFFLMFILWAFFAASYGVLMSIRPFMDCIVGPADDADVTPSLIARCQALGSMTFLLCLLGVSALFLGVLVAWQWTLVLLGMRTVDVFRSFFTLKRKRESNEDDSRTEKRSSRSKTAEKDACGTERRSSHLVYAHMVTVFGNPDRLTWHWFLVPAFPPNMTWRGRSISK